MRYFYSFADTHFSSLRSLSRSFIYKLNVQCIVQIYLLLFIQESCSRLPYIHICGCCLCPRFLKHPRIIFHDGTRIFKRFTYFYVYNMLCPLSSRIYVLFESSSSRSDQSRRERKKLITMRTRSYIDPSTSTTTHLISLAGKLFNSQYCTSMHYCIFVTISMFPYPMEKLIGFNSNSSSFSA